MTAPLLTTEDLESIRDHAMGDSVYVSLATEVLVLRARAAYVLSHGDAWAQRVMRGELDGELASKPAPSP